MSIELDPAELGFEREAIFFSFSFQASSAKRETLLQLLTYVLESGPFNREVVRTLRIRNNNYDPVAFKVRCSPNSTAS